jgi:hypothetical protein
VALVKLLTPSPSHQRLRRTVRIHRIIHGARIGKVGKVDPAEVLNCNIIIMPLHTLLTNTAIITYTLCTVIVLPMDPNHYNEGDGLTMQTGLYTESFVCNLTVHVLVSFPGIYRPAVCNSWLFNFRPISCSPKGIIPCESHLLLL